MQCAQCACSNLDVSNVSIDEISAFRIVILAISFHELLFSKIENH